MLAVRNDNLEIAKLLLDRGAEPGDRTQAVHGSVTRFFHAPSSEANRYLHFVEGRSTHVMPLGIPIKGAPGDNDVLIAKSLDE